MKVPFPRIYRGNVPCPSFNLDRDSSQQRSKVAETGICSPWLSASNSAIHSPGALEMCAVVRGGGSG